MIAGKQRIGDKTVSNILKIEAASPSTNWDIEVTIREMYADAAVWVIEVEMFDGDDGIEVRLWLNGNSEEVVILANMMTEVLRRVEADRALQILSPIVAIARERRSSHQITEAMRKIVEVLDTQDTEKKTEG